MFHRINQKYILTCLNYKKSKGAILEQKHFESLEEILALKETIIVNCMSMGSRELFNDQEFIPVRGQVVYFKPQEGIDYLLYQNVPNESGIWVSMFPWGDRIILGGVYEYGEEAPVINPVVINKIIQNAEKCFSGTL